MLENSDAILFIWLPDISFRIMNEKGPVEEEVVGASLGLFQPFSTSMNMASCEEQSFLQIRAYSEVLHWISQNVDACILLASCRGVHPVTVLQT